jgi:hypothetical protein
MAADPLALLAGPTQSEVRAAAEDHYRIRGSFRKSGDPKLRRHPAARCQSRTGFSAYILQADE